jgi:hypothetical protein
MTRWSVRTVRNWNKSNTTGIMDITRLLVLNTNCPIPTGRRTHMATKNFLIDGIDISNGNLSKDEEIKVLTLLHNGLRGTGNYLESLFSQQAVEEWSQAIRNDWAPNPMDHIRSLNNACDAAEHANRELRDRVKVLESRIAVYEETITDERKAFNRALDARQERIEHYKQLAIDRGNELTRLKAIEHHLKEILRLTREEE